jgi:hypothetical protein
VADHFIAALPFGEVVIDHRSNVLGTENFGERQVAGGVGVALEFIEPPANEPADCLTFSAAHIGRPHSWGRPRQGEYMFIAARIVAPRWSESGASSLFARTGRPAVLAKG